MDKGERKLKWLDEHPNLSADYLPYSSKKSIRLKKQTIKYIRDGFCRVCEMRLESEYHKKFPCVNN